MNHDEYAKMAAVEFEHWWFQGRREILAQIIAQLDLGSRPLILEAGCGTGGNLPMLSGFGEVCAFEMSPVACEVARQRSPNLDIRSGCFPDTVPFQDRTFDLICLFDVLEHVQDDIGTLQALHRLLTPSGVLLITVPAFPALWSQHDVNLHHHRRYVKSNLLSVLSEANLSGYWASYFNTLLFPLALASRWYARLFRRSPPGDTLPPRWLNQLLRKVFVAERHLLYPGRLPFGVSLIAIARRRNY